MLSGTKLNPFKPQSSHLSLITTGDHYAVATKGWFCLEVQDLLCIVAVMGRVHTLPGISKRLWCQQCKVAVLPMNIAPAFN